MVEGEDLGDNPAWLNFSCECGNSWGGDLMDDFEDQSINKEARLCQ
jgi:hypothetical protein